MIEPVSAVSAASVKEAVAAAANEAVKEGLIKEASEVTVNESSVQRMMTTITDIPLESLKAQNEAAIAKLNQNTETNMSKLESISAESDGQQAIKQEFPKPFKDGPEDKQFDINKDKHWEGKGYTTYEESDFKKGDARVPGRKPSPDGMSENENNGGTKIYWEDKRPSECASNSWLSTYDNDPIKEERLEAKKDYEEGKITKAEAEAKAIIAEHDDHYAKKGERWNDPEGVSSKGGNEKLGLRMPDSDNNKDRIAAIVKELKDTGRNPEVRKENGIVHITYDVKK